MTIKYLGSKRIVTSAEGTYGSGGGSGGAVTSGNPTGAAGQGNSGGYGTGSNGNGGGGGGSSSAGTNGSLSSGVGSDGGSGTNNNWTTGSNVGYAGGGAGGHANNSGGSGTATHGAHAGAYPNNVADANTGAGGSAGDSMTENSQVYGGTGGSGIVVVRYLTSGAPTVVSSVTSSTVGSYTVHRFISTGSFQITSGSTSADILVVGGGGSGGTRRHGAGGGAGGYIETLNKSLGVDTYTITIGAGGASTQSTNNVSGSNGTYSAFDDGGGNEIKAKGGGFGGGYNDAGGGGTSPATKPTNVQDNSILVEKDTAERYWFEGVPTAPTTTSNFPSGNNTSGSVNIRINIPTNDISVSNGSVSFWVYRPSSGASADNQYVAFSVSNDTQASTEFFVGVYGNSNTVKLMSRNNGSWLVSATAGTVPVGAWSHIVYTNNTSTGNKIYVNGVVTSPSYSQGSASSDVFTDNISFNTSTIGASKDSSNGYEWGMIGNLQQLLIYGKTLSQADVTALYNGGKYGTPSTTDLLRKYELTSDANDTSGNGHNGTVAGSLTYTSLAIPQGIGTWTNPLENVGQIAQLSGSDSANSYTAASEFYSIPTDTWGSVFNIASGGRGRGGSAGTPTHCYLLGGQDGSKYYNEVDRIAWADKTQNATTMSGTRAWGNTVSNAVSVCVGQSFYYGSYSNSIDEFTYPTMTSTSQGNTSANFAFSGAFGNSSFGFVAKNATINKYTYSDKSNTNSSLATPPSPPNHAGHTGNSTVGMSINNSSASTNAKYDTYNIAANTWASNTVTSTTSYEDGRASGSTKYNLYSTQTNKSVARSCEKFNYGSGTLTSFTSVTTNLDGADGDAGASSNNTGVTS